MSTVTDNDPDVRDAANSRNGHEGQPNLPGLEPPEPDYESRVMALRALVTGQSPEREFWHEIDGKRFDGLSIGLDEEGRLWGATWATWYEREIRRAWREDQEARDRERADAREERLNLIAKHRETHSPALAPTLPGSVTTLMDLAAWVAEIAPNPNSVSTELQRAMVWWMQGPDNELVTEEMRAAGCGYCNRGHYYYVTMCAQHAWSRIVKPHLDTCDICGRTYLRKSARPAKRWVERDGRYEAEPWPSYCDELCRSVADTDRRRAVRADSRNGLVCASCGELFEAPRSDARYCSSACRQRAYRSRRKSHDRAHRERVL